MRRFAPLFAVLCSVMLSAMTLAGCQTDSTTSQGSSPATTPVSPTSQGASADTPPSDQREIAILAGGCFWGMEEILRSIPGVIETEVGYAGGKSDSPTYDDVKTGKTGHAESVRVVFDPARISYEDLLAKWFFRMHDPTTKNRQGNDIGSQYRSAIFVTSPEQRKVAEAVKKRIDEAGHYDDPVVTEIVEAGPFTPAEGYHQDYLQKHPGGYTCHFLRDWDTI
jgi:peptide methionine sulfoxide reductase msrA/msrB